MKQSLRLHHRLQPLCHLPPQPQRLPKRPRKGKSLLPQRQLVLIQVVLHRRRGPHHPGINYTSSYFLEHKTFLLPLPTLLLPSPLCFCTLVPAAKRQNFLNITFMLKVRWCFLKWIKRDSTTYQLPPNQNYLQSIIIFNCYNIMPISNGLFMVRMKIGCSMSVINDTPPQIPVRLLLLKEE